MKQHEKLAAMRDVLRHIKDAITIMSNVHLSDKTHATSVLMLKLLDAKQDAAEFIEELEGAKC
jgi:hypothetical protein